MTSPRKKRFSVVSLNRSHQAPAATRSTLQALASAFPDHDMHEIYVTDHLRRAPLSLAAGVVAALRLYGLDIARGRKKLKYAVFRTPWMHRWIRRHVSAEIRANGSDFSLQLQSLFDASAEGIPNFVYTDHVHLENLRFDGFGPGDLYSRGWIDCEREIYRNAARIFTWSGNVSRALFEDYGMPPERVECVFTGSNARVPETPNQDRARYAAQAILFVGFDWQRKGGPVLVEAFRRLRRTRPEARLTILGRIPEGLDEPGIDYVGSVPLDRLPDYYAAASVFCMPTRLEPFGNVFVEAMWHALPIVATRVGALPDMVEDGVNGRLVPPGDADALADALAQLLDDPDLCAAFGGESRRKAAERYSWEMVGQRLRRAILESLAERRDAPGG